MSTLRHRHYHIPTIIILIILTHGRQLQDALAAPIHANHPVYITHNIIEDGRTMRYYHVNLDGNNNRNVQDHRVMFDNKGGDQQLAAAAKGGQVGKRVARSGLRDAGEEDGIASGQDYADFETQALMNDDFVSLLPRKRGFSVLARWKPFTNISKLRVSSRQQQQQLLRPTMVHQVQTQAQQLLRSAAAADDYDVISAETRAMLLRPSGQPLRWG